MSPNQMDKEQIFNSAADLADESQRAAYLAQACGNDAQLRAEIEELLCHDVDAGSFLEQPAIDFSPTIAVGEFDTVDESSGDVSLAFLEPSDKAGCVGTMEHYEVIELVGRGGMGLVLRAFDPKLNRVVAIKVMAPELAANTMAVKRFLREARAAAAVSHDHVVTIHAIHDAHRPPFIVMEFVDGPSLQEKIDQTGGLELERLLRIGMQTARGLSAAHEQGLVHRDVKPANILLENGVERVKLTDFGLARAVDDVSVTQTGQIVGSPQFMSPEQAEGQPIDARSDLFSLGSVLYTMCTGRPPFRAETAIAMLRRVTDDTPRTIREVNAEIPAWLEAIIFKLLAKDPAERFQSAAEVADLLSQHLAHLQSPTTVPQPQPVVPPKLAGSLREPKPLAEQADTSGKPASRRKWPAIAISVVALLCGIVVLGTIIYFQTNHGTVRVEVLDPDTQVTLRGDRDQIIEIKDDDVTLRVRPGENSLRIKHGDLEFETDKFTVRRGDKILVRVSRIDGIFEVRASGTIIGRQRLSGGVVSASVARRPTLYTISQDGDLVRINLSNASFQVTVVKKLGEAFCDVEGLAMSDDGTLYAAVHGRNDASHLYTIDIQTGTASKIGAMGVAEVDGLAWRYGQLYAVTWRFGGHNGQLLEVEPRTGQTHAIGKRLPLNDLDSLAFDDLGRLLTTDGMGIVDKIYQLDRRGVESPKPLAPTPPIVADRDIEGLTLAADGKLYGVTHPNSENQGPNLSHLVRIDPETFEYEDLGRLDFGTLCIAADLRTAGDSNQLTEVVRFEGHRELVHNLDFAPNGWQLVTGCSTPENRVVLWDARNGRRLQEFTGHQRSIHDVKFSPDGRYVASAGKEGVVMWEVATGGQLLKKDVAKAVKCVRFSSDDTKIASAAGAVGETPEIVLWRLPQSVLAQHGFTDSQGMKLVMIPAGDFEMGTADDDVEAIKADDDWFFADFVPGRREAETPQHRVTISKPFEMSAHEVTVAQFRQFVEATGYKTTAEQERDGYSWRNGEWQERSGTNWRNPGFAQTGEHPVCNVSWDDAVAFCRWLSDEQGTTFRLPTEAEWEYACRAGSKTLFSTGDDPNSLQGAANLADATLRQEEPSIKWAVDWEDGFAATAPVGSFAPNAFGLYDMVGNVWEWCQDMYDLDWYEASPETDPHCRSSTGSHVFRGGGFDNWIGFLRSADRYSSHSDFLRTQWAGFRVVREVASSEPLKTSTITPGAGWVDLISIVDVNKFGDSNVIGLGCGLTPGVVWETLELRMLDGEATITSDKITVQKRQTSPKNG